MYAKLKSFDNSIAMILYCLFYYTNGSEDIKGLLLEKNLLSAKIRLPKTKKLKLVVRTLSSS